MYITKVFFPCVFFFQELDCYGRCCIIWSFVLIQCGSAVKLCIFVDSLACRWVSTLGNCNEFIILAYSYLTSLGIFFLYRVQNPQFVQYPMINEIFYLISSLFQFCLLAYLFNHSSNYVNWCIAAYISVDLDNIRMGKGNIMLMGGHRETLVFLCR